ncbi:hypothetical protein MGN70_003188 [Eutypa lata]|nr:hypothetical protein MGN70_003188 [Eutypa lata]
MCRYLDIEYACGRDAWQLCRCPNASADYPRQDMNNIWGDGAVLCDSVDIGPVVSAAGAANCGFSGCANCPRPDQPGQHGHTHQVTAAELQSGNLYVRFKGHLDRLPGDGPGNSVDDQDLKLRTAFEKALADLGLEGLLRQPGQRRQVQAVAAPNDLDQYIYTISGRDISLAGFRPVYTNQPVGQPEYPGGMPSQPPAQPAQPPAQPAQPPAQPAHTTAQPAYPAQPAHPGGMPLRNTRQPAHSPGQPAQQTRKVPGTVTYSPVRYTAEKAKRQEIIRPTFPPVFQRNIFSRPDDPPTATMAMAHPSLAPIPPRGLDENPEFRRITPSLGPPPELDRNPTGLAAPAPAPAPAPAFPPNQPIPGAAPALAPEGPQWGNADWKEGEDSSVVDDFDDLSDY